MSLSVSAFLLRARGSVLVRTGNHGRGVETYSSRDEMHGGVQLYINQPWPNWGTILCHRVAESHGRSPEGLSVGTPARSSYAQWKCMTDRPCYEIIDRNRSHLIHVMQAKYTASWKKVKTILDRNVKSQHILTKLCALDSKCISEKAQNFVCKYSLTVKLLIFKHRRRNISVSLPALLGNWPFLTGQRPTGCVKTVQLLTGETPDLISATLWPAISPDLIWLPDMGEAAGACVPQPDSWRRPDEVALTTFQPSDQPTVDWLLTKLSSRLQACIRACGGYFKHRLQIHLTFALDSHLSKRRQRWIFPVFKWPH